jgi:hypothetical protein
MSAKFAKLSAQLAAHGAHDPAALAAWIGRKKYGKAGMAAKAKLGEAKRGHLTKHHADRVTANGGHVKHLNTATLKSVKKELERRSDSGVAGSGMALHNATAELRRRGA